MSQAVLRPATGIFGGGGTIARAVVRVAAFLAAEWRYGRDLKSLATLDDRSLRDIGLGRSEMESAVRHGRRRVGRAVDREGSRVPLPSPYLGLPPSFTEWR